MLEPVPASTVVVCRITTKWPHKILLLKRSERAHFLPGAHVFPGGRVEERDHALGTYLAADSSRLTQLAEIFGADRSTTASYVAAAIRETLEETGFSILRDRSSSRVLDATMLKKIINDGASSTITPNLDTLWPISWWITPHGESRRFDTRFFLALVDNETHLDEFFRRNNEGISDYRWLSPEEALRAYDQKAIFLAPPTRSILERMAKTLDLVEFLDFVDRPLKPIKPFFIDDDAGKKILILPGDPAHHESERPRMLLRTRYAFP